MTVHKRDGTIMKLREYSSGLYYCNVPIANKNNDTNVNVSAYCFIETGENNKTMIIRKEVDRAEVAHKLHTRQRHPSQLDFLKHFSR